MITVRWHEGNPNCITYRFEGVWNWQELKTAYQQARQMERARGHKVDVIVTMQADTYPCGFGCTYITDNNFILKMIQRLGTRDTRTQTHAAGYDSPQSVQSSDHPQ
jgi:hypothetical protein